MKKQKATILYSLIALLVGFLGATAVARVVSSRIASSVTPSPVMVQIEKLTYEGIEGKDILSLLEDQAIVKKNAEGKITAINGVVPPAGEEWSVSINGTRVTGDPVSTFSKTGDTVTWMITEKD